MRLAPLLLLAGLSGCADTGAMRALATSTSATVAAHEAALKDFVADQQALDAGDAAELSFLGAVAADAQARTEVTVAAWRLSQQSRLLAQEAIATAPDAAAIVASLQVAAPPTHAFDDGGASARLATARTQFAQLARPPTTLERLKSIYASADAVYSALETLKSKAAADSKVTAKPAAGAK